MKLEENNLAFIDGQNMHFGTTKCNVCSLTLAIDIQNIIIINSFNTLSQKTDLRRYFSQIKHSHHLCIKN